MRKYICESEDVEENGRQSRGIDVSSHRQRVEEVDLPCAHMVHDVEELETFFRRTGLDRVIVYRSLEQQERSKHCLSDLNMWYPADVLEQFTTQLHRFVSPDMEIPTIDVLTQEEGPVFTVTDVQRYFQTPVEERDRMLNIVSFNLAFTDLHGYVVPPSIVRDLDLVRRVWPRQDMARFQKDTVWNPFAFLHDEERDAYAAPETITYLLLGPAGAYTDWHVDMGGSSVWYHVVRGRKVFMAAPNTPNNIQAFLEWSSSEEQVLFLGERLEGCVQAVLQPGDTLFLPGGWFHAVSTPEDSIVLGGNYINPLQLGNALRVVDIEKELRIGRDAMYPKYEMLMYYAACDFIRRIEGSKGVFETRTMVSRHEEEGLPHLVSYFETLVGSLVQKAARRKKDAEVFKRHVDACVERMEMVVDFLRKSIDYLASIKSGAESSSGREPLFEGFPDPLAGRNLYNIQSLQDKR